MFLEVIIFRVHNKYVSNTFFKILLHRFSPGVAAPLDLCLLESSFDLFEDKRFCNKDRNALFQFYKLSKGESWLNNAKWGDQYTPHCGWHGVDCTDTDSVTGIALPNNGVSGRIDPSIGKLKDLHTINLSGNNIEGRIPSEFGQMSTLTDMKLNHNALSGAVPRDMKKLNLS